jgi:hypothetical protein
MGPERDPIPESVCVGNVLVAQRRAMGLAQIDTNPMEGSRQWRTHAFRILAWCAGDACSQRQHGCSSCEFS